MSYQYTADTYGGNGGSSGGGGEYSGDYTGNYSGTYGGTDNYSNSGYSGYYDQGQSYGGNYSYGASDPNAYTGYTTTGSEQPASTSSYEPYSYNQTGYGQNTTSYGDAGTTSYDAGGYSGYNGYSNYGDGGTYTGYGNDYTGTQSTYDPYAANSNYSYNQYGDGSNYSYGDTSSSTVSQQQQQQQPALDSVTSTLSNTHLTSHSSSDSTPPATSDSYSNYNPSFQAAAPPQPSTTTSAASSSVASNPFDKIGTANKAVAPAVPAPASSSSSAASSSNNNNNPFDKIASSGGNSSNPFDKLNNAGAPASGNMFDKVNSNPPLPRERSGSVQFDSAKREKALQLGGAFTPCAECSKPVYLAEEIRVIGKVMHKLCFKCSICKTPLSVSTFGSFENIAYCKAHHIQVMKAAPVLRNVTLSEHMLRVANNTRPQPHIHTETEEDVDDPDKNTNAPQAPVPTAASRDLTPTTSTPTEPAATTSRPTAFEPDTNLQTQLPQKEPPDGVIEGLVVMLESPDLNTRAKAAAALCNITAASQKSVISAANGTVIPQLVTMLKMPATQSARYLRAAAAGCLCNFAFNAENRAKINKAGAVPVLVSMLGPEDPFVSAHAAGALWSLLVGSDETKDLLAQCGGFEPLVKMLSTGDVFAQSQAAGALSESCCKNARNKLLIGQSGAIPIILKLAVEGAPQLQRAAMLSLCNLLANCESNKSIAMKENALKMVITVLNRDDIGSETIAAALGTIVNLPSTEANRKLARTMKLKERVRVLAQDSSPSVTRNAEKVLRWLK